MPRPYSTAMIGVVLLVGGCATGSFSRTRAALDIGDQRAAATEAGENPAALRAVSLAVLVGGLAQEETRPMAARGLMAAGDEATRELRRLSESDDVVVATAAAALLVQGGRGNAELIALLRQRLSSDDVEMRVMATRALAARSADQVFLEQRLSDPAPAVRRAAIEAVVELEDRGVARRVLAELAGADDDPTVRARALRALARLDGTGDRSVELARQLLEGPRLALRLAAIEALTACGEGGEPRALLRHAMTGEPGPAALRAALVLAHRGDSEALESLARSLRSGSTVEVATVAVGSSGLEALEAALLVALDRGEAEVRLAAGARLLGSSHRSRATAVLRSLTELPGPVGVEAALVLARDGDGDARQRLHRALEGTGDSDERLRARVAAASGLMEGGFDLARRALGDESALVRVAGAAAMLRQLRRGTSR